MQQTAHVTLTKQSKELKIKSYFNLETIFDWNEVWKSGRIENYGYKLLLNQSISMSLKVFNSDTKFYKPNGWITDVCT